MKKNESIVMPKHCKVIGNKDMEYISGGALTASGILGFISYMLSGLSISFGSNNNRVNTDTVGTFSQGSTSTSSYGGTSTSVSSSATHANVDTVSHGQYVNWGADFNLGGIFNALIRLFL